MDAFVVLVRFHKRVSSLAFCELRSYEVILREVMKFNEVDRCYKAVKDEVGPVNSGFAFVDDFPYFFSRVTCDWI